MMFDAWEVTGWSLVPSAHAEHRLAAPAFTEISAPADTLSEAWDRPARRTAASLVVVDTPNGGEIVFLPGSQSLALEEAERTQPRHQLLAPGQNLLLDSRLVLRSPAPATLRLRAFAAATPAHDLADRDLVEWHCSGYAFLRGALERSRTAALSRALDRCFAEDIATYGVDALKQAGHYGALRNLCSLDPVFVELLNDNPAYALIDRLLRPGYVLQTYDGLILSPGEGRYPWDFHTDLETLNGLDFPYRRVLAVNVLYYLDHTFEANGATRLVPHSHLSQLERPSTELLSDCAIPAEGDPGDIVIFDSRLWHCAGTNRSLQDRRLIKTLFCEPWIRPAMDYPRATPAECWRNLPPRVRALLGEQNALPTTVSDFRGFPQKEVAR